MADLSGLTVVAVEHAVAAPYASMRLADAGARVIKVERPEGDFARGYDALVQGESAYFVWLNRGKESIALDLKATDDRALLAEIIATADVLIQNLGPGVMDRLGFGADDLRARYPGLIYCSISGYGAEGPRARQKAYDLLIQAESGLSSISGTPDGMARVGVSVCDIAAGMTAYQAILEALIGRATTGQGRHVEVSLFQSMADWLNVPYLQYRYGGKAPERQGLQHPTIAPYGLFTCGDGKALLISVQNDREWRALCTALGSPEMADADCARRNTDRVANRAEVDGFVQAECARRSREDLIALLEGARIACGRLSEMSELVTHPQAGFLDVATPGGTVSLLAPGAKVAGQEPQPLGPIPTLDQHGAAIREEFAGRTRAAPD